MLGAETFVHLVTGATLPDTGDVSLFGRNTRGITDGEAWLKSLDGVGMITARGILIEAFSVLQNIALSLTLDVDPIDPRVIPQAGALARDVGIAANLFDVPVGKGGAGHQDARPSRARARAWSEAVDCRASVRGAAKRKRGGIWRRPRQRGEGPRSRR